MQKLIILQALFCVILQCALCLQQVSDKKEFKKIIRTRTNVLVLFYKPGHEEEWPSILKSASTEIEGKGTIFQVNCENVKDICKKEKIDSTKNTHLKHYKDGKFHKEYDRGKSIQSVVRFLEDPTGSPPWSEDPTAKDILHVIGDYDFVQLIKKQRSKPILIMFYAPWSSEANKMKPDFAAAATETINTATLVAIDTSRSENNELTKRFNVTTLPSVMYIMKKGEITMRFDGVLDKNSIIEFLKNPNVPQSPKRKEEEADWFVNETSSDIHFVTNDSFTELLSSKPSVLVMFYAPWCGHCKHLKPEYIAAAKLLKEKNLPAVLAAVDATKNGKLAEDFKVTGYPTLKYFKDGEFKFDANVRTAEKIVEFLEDPKEPPPPPPPEKPWSEEETDVEHLGEDNYRSFLKPKKHALVMFYAPWCGHCKKAKPEYSKAAAVFKEDRKVTFAAVDCTLHDSLCRQEDVKGFPTIKYFNFGKEGKVYQGDREEEDFIAFMQNPESPFKPNQKKHWKSISDFESVNFLDSSNFDTVISSLNGILIMMYAPWCSHCTQMKPDFVKAAAKLKTQSDVIGYGFGALDATADNDLGKKYGVKGFPTLLYFMNDGTYEKYEEPRTAESLFNFVKNKHRLDEMRKKNSDADTKTNKHKTETSKKEEANKDVKLDKASSKQGDDEHKSKTSKEQRLSSDSKARSEENSKSKKETKEDRAGPEKDKTKDKNRRKSKEEL